MNKTIMSMWLKGCSPEYIASAKGLTVSQVIEVIRKEWVAL